MTQKQLFETVNKIKDERTQRKMSEYNEHLLKCMTKNSQDGKTAMTDLIYDGLIGVLDLAIAETLAVTLEALIELGAIQVDGEN